MPLNPLPPIIPTKTGGPSHAGPHRKLYDNVIKTLHALPEEFKTSLRISDFRATDIFTLNSALGASIEDAVVNGLNGLREVWDADGQYALYRFERQAQAFPDVRLVTEAPDEIPVIMGIELKGWFALSKEGEPTFRYAITPNACADADLLVVYPWVLSDVVAGSPKLLRPFVGEARYAAELRNYYWQTMRMERGGNGKIISALHQTPYPAIKTDQCSDRAEEDGGGNFGRVARYGLLDEFVKSTERQEVSGIPVRAWLTFFKIFSDNARNLDSMDFIIENALRQYGDIGNEQKIALAEAFERIAEILRGYIV
ncbi:MAG: hypothetical protein LBU43_08975 [Candidatus Accumulibacter sp.]|jgi:hypothetical protein|nr:hypothetical protein [Accumulibacter sp.]